MTTKLKYTCHGTVFYGQTKEMTRNNNKAGMHVERQLKNRMERETLLEQARRRKRNILKMREQWYGEHERKTRGQFYTLEAFVKLWSKEGFTEQQILDVLFYRSWQWLLPKTEGWGD